MEADKRIQETLEKMRGGGGRLNQRLPEWFPGIAEDEVRYIISRLKEELFIETDFKDENVFRLTAKGRDVADHPMGWIGYKKRKLEESELEFSIKKSVARINNLTIWGIGLTTLFTGTALWISLLDYGNNKSLLDVEKELIKIEKKRDSLQLIEEETPAQKQMNRLVRIDKKLLGGIWWLNEKDPSALFYIYGDTLTYVEDQNHPYVIRVKNDTMVMVMNEKEFLFRVNKLNKDSLVFLDLETAIETIVFHKKK